MSTIMKARAYYTCKIQTRSQEIAVRDPKIYFAKDILSHFAPGYAITLPKISLHCKHS